ncbi:MAG TPA: hypothetical protein DCS15_10140 [Flavobacteriales bacterium]|nr:hypothetical protein [Flavobacteriales bacterium]
MLQIRIWGNVFFINDFVTNFIDVFALLWSEIEQLRKLILRLGISQLLQRINLLLNVGVRELICLQSHLQLILRWKNDVQTNGDGNGYTRVE